MFAAALIVFRETLEAALFVGILAAAARGLAQRRRWLAAGVAVGVAGALLLAALADRIGVLADGLGQDLLNLGILGAALLMLAWHCVLVSTHAGAMAAQARQLGTAIGAGQRTPWALGAAAALAVLREGAETVLFVGGALTGGTTSPAQALAGCAAGLATGIACGALIYAGLSRVPVRRLFGLTNVLVMILAAAIASQFARVLGQAGLVDRFSTPVWDSSRWLADDSALGVVLHAIAGYDAQPSGLQVLFYVATLVIIVQGARWARARSQPTLDARRPA